MSFRSNFTSLFDVRSSKMAASLFCFIFIVFLYLPFSAGQSDCQYVGSSGGSSSLTCEVDGNCTLVYSNTVTLAPGQSLCVTKGVSSYRFKPTAVRFPISLENCFQCSPFNAKNPTQTTMESKNTCWNQDSYWNRPPPNVSEVCCEPFKCKSACGLGTKDCFHSVRYTIDKVYHVCPIQTVLSTVQVSSTRDGQELDSDSGVMVVAASGATNPYQGKFMIYEPATRTYWLREDILDYSGSDICAIQYSPEGVALWKTPGKAYNGQSTCLVSYANKPRCNPQMNMRITPGEQLPFKSTFAFVNTSGIYPLIQPSTVLSVSIPGTNFTGKYNSCPIDVNFNVELRDCPLDNWLVLSTTCAPQLDSPSCILYLLGSDTNKNTTTYSIVNNNPNSDSCDVTFFNSKASRTRNVRISKRICDKTYFTSQPITNEPAVFKGKSSGINWSALGISLGVIGGVSTIIILIVICCCCPQCFCMICNSCQRSAEIIQQSSYRTSNSYPRTESWMNMQSRPLTPVLVQPPSSPPTQYHGTMTSEDYARALAENAMINDDGYTPKIREVGDTMVHSRQISFGASHHSQADREEFVSTDSERRKKGLHRPLPNPNNSPEIELENARRADENRRKLEGLTSQSEQVSGHKMTVRNPFKFD